MEKSGATFPDLILVKHYLRLWKREGDHFIIEEGYRRLTLFLPRGQALMHKPQGS